VAVARPEVQRGFRPAWPLGRTDVEAAGASGCACGHASIMLQSYNARQ
jgi:hypothetical protein